MLISAFLLAVAVQAQGDSAYGNTALEFVKLTSINGQFDMAINQIGKDVLDAKKAAYHTEAKATLNTLYGNMANLFMEEFTHEELKELVAFYNTNLGKKFASKQTVISQKAMSLGVSWGNEVELISKKYKAQ